MEENGIASPRIGWPDSSSVDHYSSGLAVAGEMQQLREHPHRHQIGIVAARSMFQMQENVFLHTGRELTQEIIMATFLGIILSLFTGLVGGGALVFIAMWIRRSQMAEQAAELKEKAEQVEGRRLANEVERKKLSELESQLLKRQDNQEQRERAFAAKVITYDELQKESEACKRDLRNIEMSVRKSRLDTEQLRLRQDDLDARSRELASRYLKENVKNIGNSVNARNYTVLKQRLLDVIERCRKIGFVVESMEETHLLKDLQEEFEKAVRAEMEKEAQNRIRAQIREEERVQREIDRELKQAEREREAIKAALDRALALAQNGQEAQSLEVEQLRIKLAEVEAKSQRAMSRAQMTRSGHVYVISNLGAFGEGVYKIGMTRREQPKDRVIELGDASVPFPFDVHMMIFSEDAPRLETAIHRALHRTRLNKINPRKEYFKTSITEIAKIVTEHHGTIEYIADMEALEFKQSQSMPEEDARFIEELYDPEEDRQESIPDSI
jgi:hypothetical protein